MEQDQKHPHGSVFSAICLVGGTCIGGGMLALPVATGMSGFLPSMAIMFICWLAMTLTALLLLEITLWMEDGVHVITMTSRLLGKYGEGLAWVLFLFISYASIIAYTAGGGMQIASTFTNTGYDLSKEVGCALFIIVFGLVLYLGNMTVGRVNSILFIGMIAAYVALVGMGVDEVKPYLLMKKNWAPAWLAFPILLTAFSFQTMVPSLTPYLKKNVKGLRLAIIFGTILAFLIYAIWQAIILGIIPVDGENGLAAAYIRGEPATSFLKSHVEGRWISELANFFAFFAIVTSFLGMALGLFDFLADGLKIKKEGWGNVWIGLLIAIPTYFCATFFERIFLVALDATGGFGDSILNGILPVLMVWIGRYHLNYQGPYRVMGGKPLLAFILIFFGSTLILTFLINLGVLQSCYPTAESCYPHYDLIENKFPEI